jgi:nucleoside-diphosphate-sugar epimerase
MNVLVTGGGGFIGSAIVHELIKKNFNVTSFSRGDYPELRKIGAKTIRGDLSDINSVLKASEQVDIVFHVAAKAGVSGNYKDYYRTNVIGTCNVINACKRNMIKYLVFTGSASVVFDGKDICGKDESLPYPKHYLSYYSKTKALAEQIILQSNSSILRTISLRPHLVYGPGDNHLFPGILRRARSGKLRVIGNGRNLIDVSFIDNVVTAHLNAASALMNDPGIAGKAYFITNDEPVLLWNFLGLMLKMTNNAPISKSVPTTIAYLLSAVSETIHRTLVRNREPLITRFLVKELTCNHWFDISNARKDLNYSPEVSNIEGIRKMAKMINPG